FALESRTKFKMFYVATLFIIFLAEILTFSRAGWIATIVILALIFIFSHETILRLKSKFFLILLAFIAILMTIPYLGSRITVSDNSTESRIYYDLAGLRTYHEKPVFGFGLGNLMPAVAKVEKVSQPWQIQPPHNYFIDVACETGLIGVAIIIYVLSRLIY